MSKTLPQYTQCREATEGKRHSTEASKDGSPQIENGQTHLGHSRLSNLSVPLKGELETSWT
jgi:hypothetical protein